MGVDHGAQGDRLAAVGGGDPERVLSDDPELAAFAREHIRSVWAVELLLLLRRDPERCWAPEDLVRELRASANLVRDNLASFQKSGLAVEDHVACWRYAPAGPVLDNLAARLEAAYRERPVSIINLIAAPPDPIQGLADAFKWRGDR
jgi:hypothetical protein